jgi:DNA-binding CsgD family transcriptional regulator
MEISEVQMQTQQQPRRRSRASTRKLSAREEEVLRQLAWGATHQEVADNLQLSVKTIETHKANAARKLRLRSRQELVRYAVLEGWLSVEPITAIEKRIAALKAELAAMKVIVKEGIAGWEAGKPVSPKVNAAFRRVLEIGAALQEAAVVLDGPEPH